MGTIRLDDQDMMLLNCVAKRMTFREMAEEIQRAVSATHLRVHNLQELGLVTKPEGKARSVLLTELGEQVMSDAGFRASRPF